MKRNPIARIILYSIIALVLTAVLCGALQKDGFVLHIGTGQGTTVEGEMQLEASQIKHIEIDWAAGSVRIQVADTRHITVSEVAPENCKHKMTYQISGDTLELRYSNDIIGFGFGNFSMPNKDLIITVPHDWSCGDLEIDGAALDIDLQNLTVGNIELDGASCDLHFAGSLEQLDIDGASTKITLVCNNRISEINMDGASCSLDLTLPKDCGFQLNMDGLSCDLHTDLPGTTADGQTTYGDGHCKINVDGISCDVTIREAEARSNAYTIRCANDFTVGLLMEPLATQYAPGTIVKLKTDILTDVDLELYVDGQFICKQTEAFHSDGSNYWEFYFTMPDHNVTIELKTSGGLLPD